MAATSFQDNAASSSLERMYLVHRDNSRFIAATQSSKRLVVDENAPEPRLVAAEYSFRGRLLSCLAKLPLLRDIVVVKRHTECVRAENQRALQGFIKALAEC